MNHYINLLEDSEKHFFSAVESSPLVKVGGAVGAALILGGVYLMIHSMSGTIREADTLTRRWAEIKDDVAAARDRASALRRIEDSHATLLGWSPSRYNWAETLQRIQEDLPEPRERFQFTRLHLEETLTGLRQHRPGIDEPVHPWIRKARGELRGFITGFGAESAYAQIERSLLHTQNDTPALFSSVLLENSTLQTGAPGEDSSLFLFNFSLTLTPRPVLPPEHAP